MKKETKTYLALVIIVVLIVVAIIWLKNRPTVNNEVVQCIAKNSTMIISKTCSACAYQKEILGESLRYFNAIDITEHPEVIEQYGISEVPTWLIDGEKYTGVQTLKNLKELTKC